MRAAVHDRYGPPGVLRLEDVQRPAPQAGEILIRVRATTVNRTDCAFRAGTPLVTRFFTGLRRPVHRILGSELAGVVEAVGPDVAGFAPDDEVFGATSPGWPPRAWRFGAHAEFVCLPAGGALAPKPANATFEEAAGVCDGAILALGSLRRAQVHQGQRVLVYGATGSIGTAAVQLSAWHFGAEVTGVCNTRNFELVQSLGAAQVIDHTRDDLTRGGQQYDVIFDAVGKQSFRRCRAALKPGGAYIATDGFVNLLLAPVSSRTGARHVVFDIPPRYTATDVALLKQLIETGTYLPVIDRRYGLEQIVAATEYVETHQKIGNVVLTLDASG